MAINQSFDSWQLPDLALPYDVTRGELFEEPTRLVAGKNLYITPGGKISRRPGTLAPQNNTLSAIQVSNMWTVETLDGGVYLVASGLSNGGITYELWYQNQSIGSIGDWTRFPDYRSCNLSILPHQAVVQRGFLYIKSFPQFADTEKLGSIIFDGTGGTVNLRPWGMLGPTTPARISGVITTTSAAVTSGATSFAVASVAGFPATPFQIQVDYELMTVTGIASTTFTVTRAVGGTFATAHNAGASVLYRDWAASSHAVTINFGWEYSYCYKTITGQYTNRVATEQNPDNLPSITGPFSNLCPKITVQGKADTTNIPSIVILRTIDGGGTFYVLDTITNTGAGAITYIDKSLVSGAGTNDPVPDTVLSQNAIGPTLTSNSPPPTNLPPLVVGVDTVQGSTPLASYQGRIWYGIGNILFFSSEEEINQGVPEESFPSGISGNFFRLQQPITNLAATTNGLYIFTLSHVYVVTGSNLQTFNIQPALENFGSALYHPRAITRFAEYIAFLTHDYRVALLNGDSNRIFVISDSLGFQLYNAIQANGSVEIKYWADINRQYLIVAVHNNNNPDLSVQFVCDLTRALSEDLNNLKVLYSQAKDFWFTPWTYPSVAMTSYHTQLDARKYLLFFSRKTSFSSTGVFAYLDPTGARTTDVTYASNNAIFDVSGTTNLITIPPGNHVNRLRVPHLSAIAHYIIFERTSFNGDTDPSISYFADDLYTTPNHISSPLINPPDRRAPSIGYKSMYCQINTVLHRIAVRFEKLGSTEGFEVQNLIITFAPDSGA